MLKCFNMKKIQQKHYICVADAMGINKDTALALAEKSLEGLSLQPLPTELDDCLVDPCNWVVDTKTNDVTPIGIHCQKYRKTKATKGFWRVRVFLIEDWEDKIIVQHNRHFDVLESAKA